MDLLDWQPQYAIGIADVDHEHQRMIELINEMYSAMERRENPELLVEFLGDIAVLIGAHFALEERHMLKARYPEYADHKADHERLLDEILDLSDHYQQDPDQSVALLQDRLSDWFGNHFRTFDARLHELERRTQG